MFGFFLIAVSLYHLIPAMLTGEIPTTGLRFRLTREAKPDEFWITFAGLALVGLVGITLLAWHALS